MSWWRKFFGLDAFDLVVHSVITGILLFWIAAENRGSDAVVLSCMTLVMSLLALDVRRRIALRRQDRKALGDGAADERIAELEQRIAELEFDRARLQELEERLDFTERLLATPKDQVRELAP